MPSSTLDPDFNPEPDRQLGIGHGTDALGPSDLSDTGSDVQGGYRAVEDIDLGLDRGTNEDADTHTLPAGDDTSDSRKTGEDTTTGRSGDVSLDRDIGTDRIESIAGDSDLENDPDAEPYTDPALQVDANADAQARDADADDADDLDNPDDGTADGEVPLFDRATRTDDQPSATRRP